MYLSRLEINPQSRRAMADLRDCQALHRTVMSAFPQGGDAARAEFGVLYRLEPQPRDGSIRLLVQSQVVPDWSRMPQGYLLAAATKDVGRAYGAIETGMLLRFRLRANATRRVKSAKDGRLLKNSRRLLLNTPEAQLAWLNRKGEQHGFQPVQVEILSDDMGLRAVAAVGWTEGRQGDRLLTFGAVLYEGVIRVTDGVRFQEALRTGIGPAKGYGFGLLSVGPVR